MIYQTPLRLRFVSRLARVRLNRAAGLGLGLVTVKMSGFMALNVRASSLEAVRFSDLPPRPPQVPMAFDLGVD